MNNKDHIEKITEQTLNSLDQLQRAAPAPYLMTRIQTRLQNNRNIVPSLWDKAVTFITRPAVALAGLVCIILLNILIITSNTNSDNVMSSSETEIDGQAFSITTRTAMYDIENIEP